MNCVKRILKILGYSDFDLQEIYGLCRPKMQRQRERQKDKLTRIKISSQNNQGSQKTDVLLSQINIKPKIESRPVTDQLDTTVKTKEEQYESIIKGIMEGISILVTLFLDAGQPLFPSIKDVANLF